MENTGTWQSGSTILMGNSLQHIGIIDSSASIDNLFLDAMKSGNSYQWLLNGNPLSNGGQFSGVTTSRLSIKNAVPDNQGTYSCRIDSSGTTIFSRNIVINDIITDVDDNGGNHINNKNKKNEIPKVYSLSQNYPNPFNPATIINYQLPKASKVLLKIYDLTGREIKTLVNEEQPAGNYKVNFDASRLASGVYFYRITATGGASSFVQTKKMILMK